MRLILTALLAGAAGIAVAQDTPPEPLPELVGGSVRSSTAIAVPVMPGDPVGRQVAEVIASDLRSTGLFTPLGPAGLPG
jgi:TolB protein